MNKIVISLLCVSALFACHTRQTEPLSTPVEQTIIEAAPAAQPATDVKTVEVAPAEMTSGQQIDTPPVVSIPQKSTPATTQPKSTESLNTSDTTSAATNPESVVSPAVPFAQKPTFDDEDTITLKDRLLHPYSALPTDPKAIQTAPWAYEQLKYGIYYGFIKAGTAYIHNRGIVDINGRPAYLLQTTAFSASVIDAFFKVRDINQSWLDATDFYSYGYGQSVREGNYKRDEWLNFDYDNNKYTGQIQKKEAPKNISKPLKIKVLDILTSLYYVRTQPLTVGQDIIFDIVNREKQYPLIVKVLKKETVKTAAGKFKCVVVEPQIRGEGIFVTKGKSLKVWLTDDEYKMPVKMSVEVFIGSVSAELLDYQVGS